MTAALSLTTPQPAMQADDLKVLMAQALRYVNSGLLPAAIKTPEQALIIMAMGRELGIPATVALRQIVVVQGKPTCSAELMLALVHRTYGQAAMRVWKTDNEACTVQYRQQGWDGISDYTFSIEDAKRANLLKNPTWTSYPAAMLRARAISATVRFAFPECISGLYTPEELGAAVTVVDGEVAVLDEPADEYPNLTAQMAKDEDQRAAADDEWRSGAVASYRRLAKKAKAFGHRQAEKINDTDPETLDDDVLAASVDSLLNWERGLAKGADDGNG